VHLSCNDTNTTSKRKRSEILHDLCHLGVLSGASKMMSEPMVRSTQTVHQSCIKISTISKWTKLSLEPHYLGVPLAASKTISEPMVCLAQTFHLFCTETNSLQREWSEIPHDPHHLGVPSGLSKTISELMARLTQTVHLSCVKISTISKWTEMTFHLSLVT
jgi:hypothetical protein